ncbi:pentapeptide repeat-containing protein [Arthrobacter sp. CG_A4]|uniref:pentapeptide repeat-containing protein n=1 Tax=Arthrobacter sp. CG_A4 TaxID=3071706 RepID=UPI003FA39E86
MLHGACLHGACLHGACLHGACLHSACLHGACLHGACGACREAVSALPAGSPALPNPVEEQQPHHGRERHAGGPGQAHQHDDGHGPQIASPHHEQQGGREQEEVQ